MHAVDVLLEVVVLGTNDGGVGLQLPGVGQLQVQAGLQAIGGLLAHLLFQVRVARHIGQQLLLDDVVGRQGPFAALVPERLLETDLGLLGGGQVELLLALAQEISPPTPSVLVEYWP